MTTGITSSRRASPPAASHIPMARTAQRPSQWCSSAGTRRRAGSAVSGRPGRTTTAAPARSPRPSPPLDRWVLRTPHDIDTSTTLATMEGYVTQAETNGGGWVILVMHHVCDSCGSDLVVSPGQLSAFLDWLQPRAANGTFAQTVGQVMGDGSPPPPTPSPPVADTTRPVTTISCNGSNCSRGKYGSPSSWRCPPWIRVRASRQRATPLTERPRRLPTGRRIPNRSPSRRRPSSTTPSTMRVTMNR